MQESKEKILIISEGLLDLYNESLDTYELGYNLIEALSSFLSYTEIQEIIDAMQDKVNKTIDFI